jgi:hypothetical protein
MVIWFMLAALYLVLLWTLGLMTFRKGHHVLFWVGIVSPSSGSSAPSSRPPQPPRLTEQPAPCSSGACPGC